MNTTMRSLGATPRFLICRLSAIGDTIHTLPLARLIKQYWPQSFLAWVVEKGPSPFVKTHPAVNETIIATKGFLKSPGELLRLSQKLRALKLDVALDPQSLTKSATLAWLSGAKQRIGFTKPIGRELAPWMNNELVAPRETHVVQRYLEVLRPLGIVARMSEVQFDLPHDQPSKLKINDFLRSIPQTNNFAVINPGAGWDSKVWPADRYAAVVRGLDIPSVVVWSGSKERVWAEEIVAGSKGKSSLAPATTLLELTALVRRCRLFIGSDTGPLHLAAAAGIPCVALYGPTRPEVCGPFGSHHVVLQGSSEPPSTGYKRSLGPTDSMLQTTAQQVLKACQQILERPHTKPNAA